jgi:hypothetical protein
MNDSSDAPRKCVNHHRKQETETLLGAPLCNECARRALRAVLDFDTPVRGRRSRPAQTTIGTEG